MSATTSPADINKEATAAPKAFVDSTVNAAIAAVNEVIFQSLEAAAAAIDEQVFLRELDKLDKAMLAAGDFVRLIKLSLEIGFDLLARRLSAEGHATFPDDELLAKYARILAPPKILGRAPAAGPELEANRGWLKTHGKEYRGQWVAVRNGELLGAATELAELVPLLHDRENVLVTVAY